MQFGNPLLNDDPNLDTQAGLELSGASDPLSGLMRSPLRNGGSSPTTPGLQPFSGDTTDFQNTINSIFARPTTPVPTTPAQAQIFYSPSTGDIVVNGSEPFNQRNASMALASEEWARQPARRFTLPDTVSDWREMSREEYNSYLETIKNPGFGRRVSEGWEHAWRGFGDTALGASLAVNPNWEWAQEAHANLTREFEENAPFLMQMRDVQNVGDGLTYVAQMAVQGVPWLVETLVSMGAGALIGGAVSGGVGAPAGAVEGFMANQALRQATRESIRTVLRNNIRRGALAFERAAAERGTTALTRQEVADFAVQNSIASADDVSRFFNFGERAFHLSRGGQMGSIGAMFGSNYAAGVGDIRNSIEAAGGDPESADSVASIWGYALPYALIESAGDLILTNPLTRAFPGLGVGPSRIGNMVRGAGLVGASEGLEEGAQYITTQHAVADATNRPVDIEPVDLLESVVGGAIAGAALGGVGGLFNEKTRPAQRQELLALPSPPIYMPDETPTGTHIAGAQIMGGLEPPDIDPNYGNAGEDTRFDITGTPVNMGTTPAQEREALRNTLSDPNITPEQRDAILQAMAALEGGADPDMEAADRYRANNPRGVLPEPTPLTPYQEPEILDTSYTPETDPLALDMMTDRPDLPPGLSTTPQQPRSRSASELWQALQNNEQLEPREFQTLREAIQTLAKQNPTDPGYANVLNQLAWIEAEQQNPEEQVDWTSPPLAPVDPNQGIGTYQMPDEPVRAKPVDNPIMEDGLPKYGQHRLKRPVDQNGKPVEQVDYIGEAERKAKKQKQDEEAPIRATERMLRDRAERDRRRSFTFGREDQRAYEQDQAEGGPAKRAAERAAKKKKPDVQANDNKEDKVPGLDEAADKVNAGLDAAEETKKNVKEILTNKEETPERVKEAAKRAKQASETKPEPAAATENTTFKSDTKLSERATKAKAELVKFGNNNKLPLSSLRGKANGLVGHVEKGHRIDKLKHPWMYANGDLLSADELREIVRSLDLDLAASGVGLRSKKVEPDVRAEQASELFHGHLVQEWKNYKNDPGYLPQFKEFILDNKLAATSWVNSKVAQMLPPALKLVKEVLADSGTVKASIRPPTTVTTILREVLTNNPDFTFKSIHPATRERSKEVVKKINDAQRAAGEKVSSIDDLAMSLSQLKSRLRAERSTQKAADEDNKYTGPLIRVSEVKSIIKRVQATIAEQGKFRTTHVFKDIEDFYARAHEEMMEAPNGAKVSFASYIMREVEIAKRENEKLRDMPDGKIVRFIVEDNFAARGVVVNYYDALVVFSDHFKTGTKRELMEVLEHEYIVHKGLKVLFRDNEERWIFLHRALQIPGMQQKINELIAKFPGYAHVSILQQVEEVIAFHAMNGPLALETLLSAKEGMHQETRHTLWQDFKQLVKDWIARLFGGTRTYEDKALDAIISHLREYAITGNAGNIQVTLYKYTTGDFDLNLFGDDKISKAAIGITTATPAETHEVLYDTANDPGRSYTPTSWGESMANTIKSNQDLLEKLQSISNDNVITPIKEGLKKVGRELVTMNQMALESKLMEKVLDIMDNTIKFARYTMSNSMAARPHADKSAVTAPVRALWGDNAPGSTEKQRKAYNRMAIVASNNKLSQLSDSIVREAPRLLVRHPNGTYTVNYDVYEALVKRGTFSKEEFLAGIEQFTVDSNGDVTSAGVAKLSEEDIEAGYDIYVIETREMAKSALITLEAMTTMLSRKNDHLVQDILRANEFKSTDEAFAHEAIQRMFKLYADIAFYKYNEKDRGQRNAQKDKARDVIVELMRTFHEKKKVADWTDLRTTADKTATGPRRETAFKWREQTNPHEDVKPFVNQIRWFLEYDAAFGDSRLARISGLGVGENRQFQMLGIFQNLINSETLAQEKENDVIQSILGNYVEMTRKGDWRVSIDVYKEDGKTRAEISPELLAVLPVIYAESKREADTIQESLAKELDGTYTVRDVDGEVVRVKFDVAVAMAPGTKTMSDAPKIKEFLQVSELVGLKLSVNQMKQIANLIENASTRKRFGLQRAGAPGMDANILRNNDETISRRAWEAAKTAEAWMLESTLSDKKNLEGDWDHLANLQRAFDIANRGAPEGMPVPVTFVRNEQAVLYAEIALLRYANQLRHTAKHSLKRPTVDIRTTKGEQKLKIIPERQSHLEHALALKESLERNQLELNLNDLISKTGPLRQMAVVSQLGTIASGIMNAFTPFTHLPSILMARHRETGYGGAFGLSEVIAEIGSAASQAMTVFHSYAEVARLKELLDEAKAGNNRTPLTIPELEAMYMETLNGKLTPQQTYSLTGGTESNISNLLLRNASRVLLKPFSAFEAATRRVAFLASYRLYKARYIAAKIATEEELNDVTSDAYKKLIKDVEWVIDHSQGNYNNINRPRSFRGDLAQYITQYKMFPLVTVLMINNLPLAQKGVVLGTLFLLAGMKGEPFADDFMDIYDTVMQKLGLQHDSLELSMTQFFEELLPGSSKWIMHGAIDAAAFGGTMSSRIAMGDIIPLTGVLRPEADIGREILNAFGPAYAANSSAVEYAGTVTDFALEVFGMRPRTTDWVDLFRKFPQGQVRGLTEAGMMLESGQIVDPQGRLTSDEVTIYNIFTRALGFYPLEASNANNAVRLDRMHTGYMKAVRARFILAYANAYRHGDDERMESISDSVRDWNEAAELTGQDDMIIRNFRSAAVRAGRAASSTSIQRTSDGAPDYSLIDELAVVLNADTETDE